MFFFCESDAQTTCNNPTAVGFFKYENNAVYSKVINKQVSFSDAFEYCRIMGSSLPTIRNEAENGYIQLLGISTDQTHVGYWLGAHRISIYQWYWFDNTPMSYENWNNSMIDLIYTTKTLINWFLLDAVSYDVTNRMVMWTNQAYLYDRNRVFGKWSYHDSNAKHGIICQKRCWWVSVFF